MTGLLCVAAMLQWGCTDESPPKPMKPRPVTRTVQATPSPATAGAKRQRRNLKQGKGLLLAGDKEAATGHLQAATAGPLTAVRVDAMLTLAGLHRERGEMPQCLAVVEQAAQVAPEQPRVQLILGQSLAAMGKTSAAEKALRKALILDPSQLMGWLSLKALLEKIGRIEEANKAQLAYQSQLGRILRRVRNAEGAQRLAAIASLASKRDATVSAALLGVLAKGSPAEREAAAEALARIGTPQDAKAIASLLEEEKEDAVRLALRQAKSQLPTASTP